MGEVVNLFPIAKKPAFVKENSEKKIWDYFGFLPEFENFSIEEVLEVTHTHVFFPKVLLNLLLVHFGLSMDLKSSFGDLCHFTFGDIYELAGFSRRNFINLMVCMILIKSYTPRQIYKNIKALGRLQHYRNRIDQPKKPILKIVA